MADTVDANENGQPVATQYNEASTMGEEPITSQPEDSTSVITAEGTQKKKKRKNKAGKTRRAITGFEGMPSLWALVDKITDCLPEFYADSPTTPDEAMVEKELYGPHVSFSERIEACIQRYRQKRRWDNTRTLLFEKYLALGGIDSTQRMFQGLDPTDIKTLTSDEIREMTARNVIAHGLAGSKYFDPADTEHWTIDFVEVVKGFLYVSCQPLLVNPLQSSI
jgi:hypothetical protein